MANNTTLPGTGEVVEDIDVGSGVKRQVVTLGDRAGNAVDVIGGLTESAPASDTASSGLNGRLQRIAQRISSLIGLLPSSLGAKAASGSLSITLATDQQLGAALGAEYETVAASQTAQVLGGTGASGDYIAGVLIVPATTSPGNVILLDSTTAITIFAGGSDSVGNLVPFFVPLSIKSVNGAWKLTTGANVSAIAVGDFT